MTGSDSAASVPSALPLDDRRDEFREIHQQLNRFRMRYKFAIDEVTTKIAILREEFEETYDHSPIEHVRSRLKSPDSLFEKATRRGADTSLDAIAETVRDIAGVRVVCPFVSDVYWIKDMLSRQADVTVVEVEDYIASPKPNGYRSLHLSIEVPVFLSDRTENVPVELQLRTIAMDFWASVEHAIYYKYDATVPPALLDELTDAAGIAADLDLRMTRLRDEMRTMGGPPR
ncbi:MAG: GTP pyrophosphokinase family protein [Nocardioides sp.]|nr:GTP pyrophosphokinase family protein [Nocardioides sp.]